METVWFFEGVEALECTNPVCSLSSKGVLKASNSCLLFLKFVS